MPLLQNNPVKRSRSLIYSLGLLVFLSATGTGWALASDDDFHPNLTLYHAAPKYSADFNHFDYVRPDAPKGGKLRLGALGSFDSLNGFILRGEMAQGLGLTLDTLMSASLDEANTKYPLIAESVAVAPDNSRVTFKINPAARWHDGMAITAQDVAWTFDTLRAHGHPFYRSYFNDVASVSTPNNYTVVFTLGNRDNKELPIILAELPVLPKHYWTANGRDFTKTTLTPPLGSGPYKIKVVDAPRRITFERDPNYWAKDLPSVRGKYNFDEIIYDYFRDPSVLLQAFFAGQLDLQMENVAKTWATGYSAEPVQDGRIVREEIANDLPVGMQGFVFNLRREKFQDRRVREAIALAFDFEWANKNVAFDAYARTQSYFENSELAARGLPSKDELKLLEPFRDQLPPEVFTMEFTAPKSDGSGYNRDNLRRARELLEQAGYVFTDGKMIKDGAPLEIEILLSQDAFVRWVLPYARNLSRIGVTMTPRVVDTAQMQRRLDQFDFDMVVNVFGQSLNPGNEQRDYWTSKMADIAGSRNLIGLKSPAVDALVEKIIAANTREELITATRALDRVLLWGHYVVPHWYLGKARVAYWRHIGRPETTPPYGLPVIETWFVNKDSSANVGAQ